MNSGTAPDRESASTIAGIVRFVLVEPQSAGNVGSAARALKNLGFSRLLLVRPACDPFAEEAMRMAVDAADLLRAAPVCDDLDDALSGAGRVVGTTRRTGRQRKPHRRIDRCAAELLAQPDAELAILFGREDHGLSDQDLDRCTHLVYLPAATAYPSFNLAQALLLVAWELRRTDLPAVQASDEFPPPATHEEREGLYRHLEQSLRTIGFLTPEMAPAMMRKLRRLFGRAGVGAEEVALLRGIARQTLWVAREAEIPLVPGPEGGRGEEPGEGTE
jgi:tRNA/rRNA methyltransferase